MGKVELSSALHLLAKWLFSRAHENLLNPFPPTSRPNRQGFGYERGIAGISG
jgi:hypothetical protein